MDATNARRVDETKAYSTLLEAIRESDAVISHIAVEGRGGLSIAQKLAYDLNIKSVYITQGDLVPLRSGTLFVDDIECTSATLEAYAQLCHTGVLVQRRTSKNLADFIGEVIDHKDYVQFSWEANDE